MKLSERIHQRAILLGQNIQQYVLFLLRPELGVRLGIRTLQLIGIFGPANVDDGREIGVALFVLFDERIPGASSPDETRVVLGFDGTERSFRVLLDHSTPSNARDIVSNRFEK